MNRRWLIAFAMLLVTMAVYSPVRHNGFVDFDDPAYIIENPHVNSGLTWENVRWAVSHAHAHNWHPVTWISHMIDIELFGLHAPGHHGMSVAIHAANALLLFLVLSRFTGSLGPAAFASALFALHPLHVESVAWAAERKDVLSTFFFLLGLLAYGRYARTGRALAYIATLGAFAFGLMAKQMVVTFPCVLLLLDYWPLRRSAKITWGKLLLEKVPFFVLAGAAGAVVYLVQRETGVLHGEAFFPASWRVANAVYSYVAYLGKLCWPQHLSVFYPHPMATLPPITVLLSALLLFALTATALLARVPYLTVGWLWYLITLLPVIGLIQVGIQGMADRYTYIPSMGIFLTLAYGADAILARYRRLRVPVVVLAGLILALLSTLTWQQVTVWKNSRTLYSHAVRVMPDNYWALNNLGAVLFAEGDREGARDAFQRALAIMPDYPGANKNLAALFFKEGRYREALPLIERALAVQSGNPEYLTAKGAILLKLGDRDGAIAAFRRALAVAPGDADAKEGLREAGVPP